VPFIAAAAALIVMAAQPLAGAAGGVRTQSLREGVTNAGIMEHLEKFQAIASANDDTRASGTPGYDASANYVKNRLTAAGYDVRVQEFDFIFFDETADPILERVSPNPEVYQNVDDFLTMEYSGSGNVTAPLVPTNDIIIPPGATASTSSSGCEPEDFPAATDGAIALVQRGTCDFIVKAQNAEAAGAVGVIIFNEGQEGRQETLNGTLGEPVGIPAMGTSFAVGEELYNLTKTSTVTMHMFTQVITEERSTSNVLADTPGGRPDRVVVVGAHLDSVPEGPGINDNGSGSGAILEVAEELAELDVTPRNKVRFAFWGAEESGLVGSEHYVASLSQRQLSKIFLNLNFDMVASPNYVRFVYDGNGSDTAVKGPSGSGQIERVFTEYFSSQGLASEPTEFSGRSDYGPFIAEGIPAGGLFTGAEGVKTEEQEEVYGGVAGLAYDPCYHQFCDDLIEPNSEPALEAAYGPSVLIGNVNMKALREMSDATAHAVLTFAMTQSSPSGTDRSGHTYDPEELEFNGSHARR
jgi:Zn-dependent M28 family amino/carboxypeptidase